MVRFNYQLTRLPANKTGDDRAVFAALFRQHYDWLCAQGIAFDVTCYYWPEMLAHLILQTAIGQTVCAIQLGIVAEASEAFSQFTGMVGSAERP